MKRALSPILFHTLLGLGTWLGFVQGVEGAANLVTFGTWALLAPLGTLFGIGTLIGDNAIKAAAKPRPPSWANFTTRAIRWACLGVLVWYGAWATSAGLLLFMCSLAIAHQAVLDARAKLAAEGA
jgi:hypothetical protein